MKFLIRHDAVSDLDLHCFPMSHKNDARIILVNVFHFVCRVSGSLKNSVDSDEMRHLAAFHQGCNSDEIPRWHFLARGFQVSHFILSPNSFNTLPLSHCTTG